MQRVPIYVVSLARAERRRTRIKRHLDRLNLKYEIIDAVDGSTLSEEYVASLMPPDLRYAPGVVGCYLSHLEIYRRFLATDAPCALILEDDATLNRATLALLSSDFTDAPFDYCFLDSGDRSMERRQVVCYNLDRSISVCPGVKAHEISDGPECTYAYLIRREGAQKRLAAAFPIKAPIDMYAHLPYTPAFYSLVSPKGASPSVDYLVSFTSRRDQSQALPLMMRLRSTPLFYRFRDLVTLRTLRKTRESKAKLQSLTATRGGRWRVMPTGLNMVVDSDEIVLDAQVESLTRLSSRQS